MSKKVEHNVVRILYVFTLASLCLYLISPFIAPIIFAGTVALAMFPIMLSLERRGLSRKKAAVLLTSGFAVLISIPFFFFVIRGTLAVTVQLQKFTERYKDQGVKTILETFKHDVILRIQTFGERFGVQTLLTEERIDLYLIKVNSFLLQFFQEVAANLPAIVLFFLVMVICTYSFLKNASNVRLAFQRILGFTNVKMDLLVKVLIMDSRSVYVSNLATGGMQSLIVASAVGLLGLGGFFLVFFITLILSFIPVIGAAPVAFVFGVIAFLRGETSYAIIMIAVGMITGVADNILRPYLASMGESRLPTIAAFIFVVGGALLLGFPGLFIGLLVGSFAYDTLPLFWEELGRTDSEIPVNYRPRVQSETIDEIRPRQ